MKTANVQPEFRIWCEHCSIRIAPHEEKTVSDGKTYHQRCYSRFRPDASRSAATSRATADTLGGGK